MFGFSLLFSRAKVVIFLHIGKQMKGENAICQSVNLSIR